jgi:uncharacterized protein YigA (DUF484 family)
MSNKPRTAQQISQDTENLLSEEQISDYLKQHPDFFIEHQELLADLTLPHASGDAVSLLERQVSILRDRGVDARRKLNHLLDNARDNDQIFEATRDIVLALLRARDVEEISQVAEDKLRLQANIDVCEMIFVTGNIDDSPDKVRTEDESRLREDFVDVFRLKRTHCGLLTEDQTRFLFGDSATNIASTALCPIIINGEVHGLLAIGNQHENYFNINLDTLFLDFIGNVVSAVLDRHL